MHGGVRGKAGDRLPISIDAAGAGNGGSGVSPTYRASSRPYQPNLEYTVKPTYDSGNVKSKRQVFDLAGTRPAFPEGS